MDAERLKKLILDNISDSVGRLVYYDRKEDEELSYETLNQALREGVVTVDEMVESYRRELTNWAANL